MNDQSEIDSVHIGASRWLEVFHSARVVHQHDSVVTVLDMKKPFFWSVASGLVWIGVAHVVAYAIYPTGFSPRQSAGIFAGGIVAAPVIGLLIGYIARRFSDLDRISRFWMALGNLHLATYLFLLASGIGHVVSEWITHRHVQTTRRLLVVDPLLGALFGLTYTGFVIVLLPLSYWNHVLIGKAWRETAVYDDRQKVEPQPQPIGLPQWTPQIKLWARTLIFQWTGPRQPCGRISGPPIWVQCASASCCSTARIRRLNFRIVGKRSVVGGPSVQVISSTNSCDVTS